MTKSKVSLGKCHIALENMWVILSCDIYFLPNSTVIREQTLYDKRTDFV